MQYFANIVYTTLTRLGVLPPAAAASPLPFLIMPALFLGPLYARALGGHLPGQQNWAASDVTSAVSSWQGVRTYIAVSTLS